MDVSKVLCPECQAPMTIRRLVCPQGHVAMEGEFEVPTLARLSLEEQLFVTAFVRGHGSIKRMEELFEISYPTVKNRLNAIIAKLDRAFDAPPSSLQAGEARASSFSPSSEAEGEKAAAAGGRAEEGRPRPLRFLRIVVDSPEPGSVNIRLPLGLVRTGLKLSTLMPRGVSQRLFDRGIDLSRLSGLDDEALIAELAAHPIDIAAGDGDKVHIFCE